MAASLHTKEYKAFVELISKTRIAKSLTQQQVADRLGKPQSYIAKIENGERRVDIVEFAALARALDCKPLELFGEWLG